MSFGDRTTLRDGEIVLRAILGGLSISIPLWWVIITAILRIRVTHSGDIDRLLEPGCIDRDCLDVRQ